MLVIGLTGSIGTGKSEVTHLLEQLGAAIINADRVGHEAYTPHSESWKEIVGAFGRDILQPGGEIDRKKLGAIVFSDPALLAKLNAIMHPRMAGMVAERIQGFREDGVPVVVVEAALLYEAGWETLVDEVWAVDSPLETVVERLRARNSLDETEVRRRIDSQMNIQKRLDWADVVVDNSGDIAALERVLKSLWETRVEGRVEQK
ncbi:MAG: dephospho-CoA kinase [SAR202 cluster bacterium Io17-Chloro-G9]|nr:MAG: dephospho-CoA kinase [SAR202 cluster bacterium Io17-Chloro-G9]